MISSAAGRSTSTDSGSPKISNPASEASGAIRRKGIELGFARVGFCDADRPAELSLFERWLDSGMQGEMAWIARTRDRRADPQLLLPGVRSLVVVADLYAAPGATPPAPPGDPTPRGRVARYALGEDYHLVLGDRLEELERFIVQTAPGHRALAYVDTGAILERMWAARAGIGWVGKNAMVLSKELGSWFFLGVVLTTLPLPADPSATDQCGSCTLCLEACPTGAIVEPRLVDSRRCLSYHTIELRGRLPQAHLEAMGSRLFGCDDCQEVCPWNAPRADQAAPDGPVSRVEPRYAARPESTDPSLLEILALGEEDYQARFRRSAIKRATRQGLRRNAAAALGAGASAGAAPALEAIARDPREDPVVREEARSSLGRLARRTRAGA